MNRINCLKGSATEDLVKLAEAKTHATIELEKKALALRFKEINTSRVEHRSSPENVLVEKKNPPKNEPPVKRLRSN